MKNIPEWINTILEDLVDSSIKLSDTLFKVQILASNLENQPLQDWVRLEISGYGSNEKPEYRKIATAVYGNLIQDAGFKGVFLKKNIALPVEETLGKDIKVILNYLYLGQSIAEIEKMTETNESYRMDLPHSVIEKISNSITNWNVDSGWLKINKSSLEGLLSNVKSKLLDFLLELNKEFGDSENIRIMDHKNKIEGIFKNTIGTINGETVNISFGNKNTQVANQGDGVNMNVASGDNIDQTLNTKLKDNIKEFIDTLMDNLEKLELDNEDRDDILNEVARVETQVERESPKFTIINSAISTMNGILTGITANAYYPIVMGKLNSLISLLPQ